MDTSIRLNKYLSNVGLVARRKVAEFLEKNEVIVNGKKIKMEGFRVDLSKDKILVNGKEIQNKNEFVYIMLNKPKGIISTVSDEHNRKTVVNLVRTKERLYPVGRLDAQSKGLIILTNDGDLAFKLTHPKFEIEKKYVCLVSGLVDERKLNKLRNGVELKEYTTASAKVDILESKKDRTILQITVHEGKNHEVRRMCAAVKLNVIELKRVAMGSVELGELATGASRKLSKIEIESLKNL